MEEQEQLSAFIVSLYDAALDHSLWVGALETLGDLLGGAALVVSVIHRDEGVKFAATARLDDQYDRLLRERFNTGQTNPLVAAMPKLVAGRATPRSSVYPDGEYFKCALYHEVFRPQQLTHRVIACLSRTDEQVMPLGVLRLGNKEEFDAKQFALLDNVLPHLQRAVALSCRIGVLQSQVHWCANVLDRLPFGVAMISMQGHVLLLNAHAQAAIAQKDGLMCNREGLCALRSSDTKRLQLLIKSAVFMSVGKGSHAGGTMTISRPSRRRPFQILVSPYRPPQAWPGAEQPAATVFITDPEFQPEHSNDLLARLYGLTPAEARLAVLLVNGASIADAAEQMHVTRNTVRNHLKQVFAKTGAKRQAELMRQLLIGPAQWMFDKTAQQDTIPHV